MKTFINDYNFKQNLIEGETIEFNTEDEDFVLVWFNSKNNNFCIEYNGKVIKASKQYKKISNYLHSLKAFTENN